MRLDVIQMRMSLNNKKGLIKICLLSFFWELYNIEENQKSEKKKR
jgi:hypothetical protein